MPFSRPLVLVALAALAVPLTAGAAPRSQATASSVVTDEAGGKHPADLAFDGLLQTGWGEGEQGPGDGAWLEIDLRTPTQVQSISLWPGNLSEGKKSYREYSRPKVISLVVDGQPVGEPIRLLDEMRRHDLPVDRTARKIRLQVVEAYEGFVFSDCYVAEVGVNFVADRGRPYERLEAWKATPAGQQARTAYLEALEQHYRAHKEAEFGSQPDLEWIMDAAGDGAPYLREQVLKHVDIGRRAAALLPDEEAVNALRRLKDPNGIPAVEMAALRATGKEEAFYAELVEIFYAHQQLIGGPDPNVPYWGATGWADGAIQSFGEPVPVAVDRFGSLYIADIGNNRVQRFADNGRPEMVWGGKPDIANTWFDRGRAWYVSGAAPGDAAGHFYNPLDVEIIPGKENDGFAVLDARGRVQLFDAEGRQLIGWQIQTDQEVEPTLGGEAYLAYVPKKQLVVVLWNREGIVYNMLGEEVGRWEIQDGTPNSVVVEKSGKLLLVYRNQIVRYDLDGFRYQVVMDMDDFAQGFEDIDIAFDQDWRLWVVVDTGWAYKFKKFGKLDYAVQITEYSLEHPRLSVRDDLLYVSERDRILKIDALKLKLDQEEAAAEAAEGAGAEGLEDF